MKCKRNYKNMDKYYSYVRNYKLRYRIKNGQGTGGHPWTEEEDKLVLEHKMPDAELVRKIGRSISAIQKRRWKLKKQY